MKVESEISVSSRPELEAYLQGTLKDGTKSVRHRTHRIAQADRHWLEILQLILRRLGARSWIYREGMSRSVWVLETTASFLDLQFDPRPLIGHSSGLSYARGYFDAEGGIPRDGGARLYLQLVQKDRGGLHTLRAILEAAGVQCGKVHNPSSRVDPNFWRFYVRACSHRRFMDLVGSWHPRKRELIEGRLAASC